MVSARYGAPSWTARLRPLMAAAEADPTSLLLFVDATHPAYRWLLLEPGRQYGGGIAPGLARACCV
ncbi:hypothetical protein M0638_24405 [Roseomonas sp. NAR14]|uniref:Uncharacterized protein n=1 Tax=Roseomonas acroporae TaxID=2937791 RepID=A0A9X1YCB8_9PROT|nr:hypothetical protein [Roseomonas acroporae]MCK8787518.1 hypothetical protein [Roseomonas acroporae]